MSYTASEFETLYRQFFPSAMRLAMSMLHDENEARDAAQEVFVRMWESEGAIDNPAGFVMRSVRNTCISRIRHLDIRDKVHQRIMLEAPPDDCDIEQMNQATRAAMDRLLTNRERQMVEKVYSEGLSYKEAAVSLGVTVSAVNKNLVAAMKKLRNHFKNIEI